MAPCLLAAGKVSWPTYFRQTANRHFTLLRPLRGGHTGVPPPPAANGCWSETAGGNNVGPGGPARRGAGDGRRRLAAEVLPVTLPGTFGRYPSVVQGGNNMLFGVIRPDWEGGYNFDGNPVDASAVDGHCFYNALNGRCSPGYIEFD